jgi:hypothetical protein
MTERIRKIQKITVHVPQNLLANAIKATHKNITETVMEGLENIVQKKAYQDFRSLKGKVKFSINFDELRND